MNNEKPCVYCANTGVVKASLVKKEDEGKIYNVGIDLVLCKEHYSLGEATMVAMEENSNLPLNVVGVQGAV